MIPIPIRYQTNHSFAYLARLVRYVYHRTTVRDGIYHFTYGHVYVLWFYLFKCENKY